MGNSQGAENLEPYRSLYKGSHVGSKEKTQSAKTSPAHDSNALNLVIPTSEGPFFGRSIGEDIEVKRNTSLPWNFSMNLSTEPVLKQKPPEVRWSVPDTFSQAVNFTFSDEDPIQMPLKSEPPATELAGGNRGDNNVDGKSTMVGDVIQEKVALLPPVLGFSAVRFPIKKPMYDLRMASLSPQFTELLRIGLKENLVTYQEQPEDHGATSENQTLTYSSTRATSQGGSLTKSNFTAYEAFPNSTQTPNHDLAPFSGNQNTTQTAEAHQPCATTSSSLESTIGPSCIEVQINTQDQEAEKITQETADTRRKIKVCPSKGGTMSTKQLLPWSVPNNTPEKTEVKPPTCFSYADALKSSPQVAQKERAPKPLDKDEKQQKLLGRQTTTKMEKKATRNAVALGNVKQNGAQLNPKNPKMDKTKSTKPCNPTGPPTPPYKGTKAQPRSQLTSPQNNPRDRFRDKSSWNMEKSQNFTPHKPIQIFNNTSTWKPHEQTKGRDAKKDQVYQSYIIERRIRSKTVCNKTPRPTTKEAVKSVAAVSVQPEDVGLPTLDATRLEIPSRQNITIVVTDEALVHTEKSEQTSKCEETDQNPEVKPDLSQPTPPPEVTEDQKISTDDHGDVADVSPPDLHIKERSQTPDTSVQVPDQNPVVLVNDTPSEPISGPEVLDKVVSVEKDVPDEDPKHQVSGKWKEFYVDNLCTMKCMCRHRPGKLPPNVVRWFSVSQNRLAEPIWITTLKVASTLVTGTNLLLDHHSPHGSDISSER
ncbi:gametogenetin [Engystomops pustulosus]|uniref:gametogenetin n=1 Tax=Engystomops pustulosus TaxID=76066 RepID=UPI003AFA49CA